MLHAGAAIVIIRGIAHVVLPTRYIMEGFDPNSAVTGARNAPVPMRLCPVIFLVAAALFFVPILF